MKKLQNDFTTPEQSKRLLELGVPADSANCYYDGRRILRARSENWMLKPDFFKEYSYFTPCWSVGRLIEIIKICCTDDNVKDEIAIEVMYSNKNSAQLIIEMTSEYAYIIDFSKLED